MDKITLAVANSVDELLNHQVFCQWSNGIPWEQDDLLLINNSFVFRDVKTTKSDFCLALKSDGQGSFPETFAACTPRFNSDFKRIPAKGRQTVDLCPLDEAVRQQLAEIGNLVFILIGRVDDSIRQSVEIDVEPYEFVIWDPGLTDLCKLEQHAIHVKETFDEDAIWTNLVDQLPANLDVAKLRQALGEALDDLQDHAVANLHLPPKGDIPDLGVTNSICEILKLERDSYSKALERLPNAQALNELLRIAYNFASDATNFIRLIVSVCDLKPVVLWGTIAKHFALSEEFRALPWSRRRNKPSLKNYESTIKDARNSAFHNLFPFRKSLSVQLPEEVLGDTELRIFSEHSKKKDNTLHYRDKPLVDVLIGFTRAREVRVAEGFWRRNVDVMDATIDLFEDTDAFLRTLRNV